MRNFLQIKILKYLVRLTLKYKYILESNNSYFNNIHVLLTTYINHSVPKYMSHFYNVYYSHNLL